MSLYNKFKNGLQKSSQYLKSNILNIKKINEESLNEIETVLLSSDLGIETTNLLFSARYRNRRQSILYFLTL